MNENGPGPGSRSISASVPGTGRQADLALLERVAGSDKTAMKQLYDTHASDLTKFVRTRINDPVEVADVVQDTMMEVWRAAGSFSGRSSVKSWIFSIARNKAVDRIRSASRTVLSGDPPEEVDPAPDAFAITAAVQDAAQLRTCLEALSPRHRAVLHLAFFQDLPYEQIAEIEECPVGTVKTRIFHAKKLMMHCLLAAKGGQAKDGIG